MFLQVALCVFIVIVFGVNCAYPNFQINTTSVIHRLRRQTSCRLSEYACANRQCISSYDKCDGTKHCADGSDETAVACKALGIECPPLSFECSYGACIQEAQRCDGKVNCADGSDEQGCTNQGYSSQISSCSTYEFRCTDGQCISGYDICDSVRHCRDGSDESIEVCWDYVCPPRSFKCSYGACLDSSLKCNGIVDCLDGSDEEGNCPTTHKKPTTRPPPPQTRPPYRPATYSPPLPQKPATYSPPPPQRPTYKPTPQTRPTAKPVTYHPPAPQTPPPSNTFAQSPAEVPGTGSCKLPVQPQHGDYVSMQCGLGDPRPGCRNTPGVVVPSTWVLKYTCNSGYSLNKDSEYSICDNGVWKNEIACIKLCSPLISLSVDVSCKYGGAETDCGLPMKPDTQASATCKPHYKQAYLVESNTLFCLRSGEWSYRLFYCVPDCGLSSKLDDTTNQPKPLINNGSPVQVGEFPWLAAVYRRVVEKWDQQCGGTLITPHIVVTAAHCLVNNELDNNVLHPTEIKVGLGKYLRNFYVNERTSVIADVKEVVIPHQYAGRASNYAQDIGLLDLVISVQVKATIMPACVDWSPSSAFEPSPNDEGLVAGWGKTQDGGESSEVALAARLRFIPFNDCLKQLEVRHKYLLTHDKFCAGDINKGQVNQGDSGGGLTFLKEGKHFLVGVVSTRFPDLPEFSIFMDITKEHISWLLKEKDRLKQSHSES